METVFNKSSIPANIDELIQNVQKHPEHYKHLKIFLSREYTDNSPDIGEEFLAVTRNGFATYRIDDIDYLNGKIIISLTGIETDEAETYTLDINNKHPRCIFIRWKDIRNMVLSECMRSDKNNDELLEFV